MISFWSKTILQFTSVNTLLIVLSGLLLTNQIFWLRSAINSKLKYTFSPIDLDQCETALGLSMKHPEIEAYRRVVVRQRALVNGDYEAMKEFAENKYRNDQTDNRAKEQKSAFDTLHNT